jgi:predicted phosphoribosyltransferase
MFTDRKEAAIQLAQALEMYKDKNAVVLGIPRGGAVTGYYVATYLHADFSLLIARKLGHPNNPEYAIGAIAEDGTLHLNPVALSEATQAQIDEVTAEQQKEIERRIKTLRNGERLPVITNRIVIIVDDGIATGATIFASIEMCRKLNASKIVVAAPVAGPGMAEQLRQQGAEPVILETPSFYHAVSQAYMEFPQISDGETAGLLQRFKSEKHGRHTALQQIIDEP